MCDKSSPEETVGLIGLCVSVLVALKRLFTSQATPPPVPPRAMWREETVTTFTEQRVTTIKVYSEVVR
jgi:hypothetical protein